MANPELVNASSALEDYEKKHVLSDSTNNDAGGTDSDPLSRGKQKSMFGMLKRKVSLAKNLAAVAPG